MATSAAPAAARHVPTSRDNKVSLPPPPKQVASDRYPDVLVYAPLVSKARMVARLVALNRLASGTDKDGGVNAPGCRFHLQGDPAEIRNLLFLPKYAVVISVSAPADKARTTAQLDAKLRVVPRFCKRWLHIDLADLMEEGCDLVGVGRKIQMCYLHQAVQLDRAVQRPMCSVFTTTYRTGTRIRRAFQSLRRQHMVDWEWVILDDSPDEGEHFDLLRKELLVGDNRVRIYRRNGNNGSIGDVKNECIGLCRGRYLLELDHDDELTPNCLADCSAVFQRDPAVGFVFTDFANVYEDSMNVFRYCEGYGLGLAGYYCRHILSADPAVSRAGVQADKAFLDGSTWFSPQYASVTPQVCPVSISCLMGMPNHPRMWRRATMDHMGSFPEFLPICDDQEILMRTQASGAKMVKLHTVCYLQYMNLPSNGSNFSGIRNQEITRMGTTGPLYKLFQEVHPSVDRLFMDADCDPDMRLRTFCHHVWDREEVPTYYNGLEHPDGDGVVVYLGMAAVVTRAAQFLADLLGPSEAKEEEEDDDAAVSVVVAKKDDVDDLFQYATPAHGTTELCDRVVPPTTRRRRRVVYVLAHDMGDMATLQALTAWVKQVRPDTTQEELCLLRAYGFDFADPVKRGLFCADWAADKCLIQYARHMYASDAEFVYPDMPPLPSAEAIQKMIAEEKNEEGGGESVLLCESAAVPPLELPADIAAMSSSSCCTTKKKKKDDVAADDTSVVPPFAFGADNMLMQVLAGNHRIVPVDFDAAAAAPAAREVCKSRTSSTPYVSPHHHPGRHIRAREAAATEYGYRSRLEIVQSFADPKRTHYLEIGVETGALFNAVRAATKTGVDPAPSPFFDVPAADRGCSTFHELTSDAYFLDPETARRDVHLAFVDGMHLSEYVARDVANVSEAIVNTLRRQRMRGGDGGDAVAGWLMLDDVVPKDRAEQERVPRGAYHDRGVLKYGAPWTGDVWKAAAVLVRKYPMLERRLFLCPEEFRGVLAIRLTADDAPMRLTAREVDRAMALDYDRDFPAYLAEIKWD